MVTHKTRDTMAGLPCVACWREVLDLSIAIREHLRTAAFNLRCDSISVLKRRHFSICILHVGILMNISEVFEKKTSGREPISVFVDALGDLRRKQGLSCSSYTCVLSKGRL